MPVLDLKPTSHETIQKLSINPHDLWHVKIGDEEFGPFESESLKHYAGENKEVLEGAMASRLDKLDWQPFFSHPLFQRRGPQVVGGVAKKEGPYWVLDLGQKVGPFTKIEIDTLIDEKSLALTELVSVDDGHSWHKLYETEGFDRRLHSSSELPFSPLEANFQKAHLELIEKLDSEAGGLRASEELAEMAFASDVKGKVLTFKAEDVPLRPHQEASIGSSLKWQVPVGMAVMMALMMGVKLISKSISSSPSAEVATNEKELPELQGNSFVSKQSAREQTVAARKPANYQTQTNHAAVANNHHNESQYPTQIETHQNDQHPEPDQIVEPPLDQPENREPANEHSLVAPPPEQNEPLDTVMGNPQPVEEASDF